MTLKAVLLDFNGVIINDESIHQELISDILIGENLRPDESEFQTLCLGRSDRACLRDILGQRGRVVSDKYLDNLIQKKTQAYQQKLENLDNLPIYPGIEEFLTQLQQQGIAIALVTGALRREVDLVLHKSGIAQYFSVIVGGDDITQSKPEPEGYLLAVSQLNLQPSECLAIEDSYPGIEAAKKAGIPVVGIANTYPLHMLQRRANWTIDYLAELELDRLL
ncbi:MAG: HAD family phosphatase [Xenococcaceae cyanobacterium MO_234.B1]|nr:HAD family phosphatase [Xenococcaceae cyanobacterium MO_234.B1]